MRSPLSLFFVSFLPLTSDLLPTFSTSSPSPPLSPVVSTAASGVLSVPGQRSTLENATETLTTLFPVWVCAGAALGIAKPAAFAWFKTDLFTYSLGFLMLSMGLTLTVDDFRQCLKNPVPVSLIRSSFFFFRLCLSFSGPFPCFSPFFRRLGSIFLRPPLRS